MKGARLRSYKRRNVGREENIIARRYRDRLECYGPTALNLAVIPGSFTLFPLHQIASNRKPWFRSLSRKYLYSSPRHRQYFLPRVTPE